MAMRLLELIIVIELMKRSKICLNLQNQLSFGFITIFFYLKFMVLIYKIISFLLDMHNLKTSFFITTLHAQYPLLTLRKYKFSQLEIKTEEKEAVSKNIKKTSIQESSYLFHEKKIQSINNILNYLILAIAFFVFFYFILSINIKKQ